MSTRKVVITTLIVVSGILFACSKSNTLVKILGTWERVNVTTVNADIIEDWLFSVDDIFLITQYHRDNPDSLTYRNEGRYTVKVKFFKRYVTIKGFSGGDSYLNDDWEIVRSNKSILILVSAKGGGLEIREFTKRKF